MMRLHKLFAFALLGVALAWGQLQAAPIDSLGEAINQAGRQRMLSQRMTKAYTMILLNSEVSTAQKQLHSAAELFQTQLDALKAFSANDTVAQSLVAVEAIWGPFKQVVNEAPTDSGLRELVDSNENLLKAAHQVVLDLESLSTTPAGHLTNIAGRQRMLSQRMAKFYMLYAYGIRSDAVVQGLNSAIDQFKTAHGELMSSPANTSEITRLLSTVDNNWDVLGANFNSMQSGTFSPFTVNTYTDNILTQMNEITGKYAALGDK